MILDTIIIVIGLIIHFIGFNYLFFNRNIHLSVIGRVSIYFTGKYTNLMIGLWMLGVFIMLIGGTVLVNMVTF